MLTHSSGLLGAQTQLRINRTLSTEVILGGVVLGTRPSETSHRNVGASYNNLR